MRNSLVIFFIGCLVLTNCRKSDDRPSNYYKLPAQIETGINMVVEIPAGTNHKIEYDPATDSFKNDQKNGKDRVIQFLPYPGNYGFIPSTLMDKKRGGDGDALDILVIGESKPTGTVIPVKPIATLQLLDGGEIDTKIIAIPSKKEDQIISALSFPEFIVEYDAVRMMIEKWFLNYKGSGAMKLVGWQDDGFAIREIEKWQIEE